MKIGNCTPATVYLILAIIMSCLYCAYGAYKGKITKDTFLTTSGISIICCQICCIIVCCVLITGLCMYNSIMAWLVVILFMISAGFGTYSVITNLKT